MSDQLTVLVDNHSSEPFHKEHGFSVFIEWGGKRILFDTAQGEALFHNADLMNIPLNSLDALILSHGHYDHGGNISEVLKGNPRTPVYSHPGALIDRYSRHRDGEIVPVHLEGKDREALKGLPGDRLILSSSPVEVFRGLGFSGSVPRQFLNEDTGGDFYLEPECLHPDPLEDDISIWLDHGSEITVICGCCHSGLRNTLSHIAALTGNKPVRNLIGGFHLLHASEPRMHSTAEFLRESGVGALYPAHCTGEEAADFFSRELDTAVVPSYAGIRLSLSEN